MTKQKESVSAKNAQQIIVFNLTKYDQMLSLYDIQCQSLKWCHLSIWGCSFLNPFRFFLCLKAAQKSSRCYKSDQCWKLLSKRPLRIC